MFGQRPWTIGLIALGGIAVVAGALTRVSTVPAIAPMIASLTASAPAQPPSAGQPGWSNAALKQLLDSVDSASAEGLHPADYQRDALAAAVAAGRSGADVDALAGTAARALGHDFAAGRVPGRKRVDWHMEASPPALATLDIDLDHAVQADRVGDYLRGLLPQDPRYVALRGALQATPPTDADRLTAIRATMERWRWMPRGFGPDYLFANVPAYQVTLYAAGQPIETHDVIVGARKTPTPQLAAHVDSIVANPWWTLPPTVLAEGKHYSAAKGFVYVKIKGGTRIRQKPGPLNALGRIKLNMPNPYAIYLHDTPGKASFLKIDRALSHGCIRVKDVQQLAERIGDPAKIDAALQSYDSRTLGLQKSLPIYITYLTAVPQPDGTVAILPDPYDRDAGVVAALDGRAVPSRPSAAPAPARPADTAAPAEPEAVIEPGRDAAPAPKADASPKPEPAPKEEPAPKVEAAPAPQAAPAAPATPPSPAPPPALPAATAPPTP